CRLFGATLIKIGTIQRRLAWPLHKDDTFNLEWMHLRVQNFSICTILKTST
ncbi:hypothetical protein C2G38_2281277, partial [Gigaspora rosea]